MGKGLATDGKRISDSTGLGADGRRGHHRCRVGGAGVVGRGVLKRAAPKGERRTTGDDLRAFLARQEKDALVEMLASETTRNRSLRERLLLEAARLNPVGVDLATYRRSI